MDKWVCWLTLFWHALIPLFTLASLCQVEPRAVSTLVEQSVPLCKCVGDRS